MNSWQYLLLAAAALALLFAAICSGVTKHKARKQRDFTRSLETLLQPKETVKVICPQKKGRCILTSSRIIFEKEGDFTAIPLKSVTKVQGTNEKGNRTTVPAKMVTLTVKIDKEYILKNTGESFTELAKQLTAKVKKQNEKKKAEARKN